MLKASKLPTCFGGIVQVIKNINKKTRSPNIEILNKSEIQNFSMSETKRSFVSGDFIPFLNDCWTGVLDL